MEVISLRKAANYRLKRRLFVCNYHEELEGAALAKWCQRCPNQGTAICPLNEANSGVKASVITLYTDQPAIASQLLQMPSHQ